jgi:hypothetical protein
MMEGFHTLLRSLAGKLAASEEPQEMAAGEELRRIVEDTLGSASHRLQALIARQSSAR